MTDSDDFDEIECDHVLTGSVARVLMAKTVTQEFIAVESKKQARLLSNAKIWADGHPPNEEQFQGNEGRCGGENDRMLVAVKVHKIRLYGFVRRYRGKKTLLIVDIDVAKKQNKANPRILKRAKAAAVAMDAKCGE
jgi:hypothetical protein